MAEIYRLLVNDGMIAVIVVPVQQQVVTDSWGWIALCFYADLEGTPTTRFMAAKRSSKDEQPSKSVKLPSDPG